MLHLEVAGMAITTANQSISDQVRDWVRNTIITPAKANRDRIFTVIAGDVHRELGLKNRVGADFRIGHGGAY